MATHNKSHKWDDPEFSQYVKNLIRPIHSHEDREDVMQEIYLEFTRLDITGYDEMVDTAYIVYNRFKSKIRRYHERFIPSGDMEMG